MRHLVGVPFRYPCGESLCVKWGQRSLLFNGGLLPRCVRWIPPGRYAYWTVLHCAVCLWNLGKWSTGDIDAILQNNTFESAGTGGIDTSMNGGGGWLEFEPKVSTTGVVNPTTQLWLVGPICILLEVVINFVAVGFLYTPVPAVPPPAPDKQSRHRQRKKRKAKVRGICVIQLLAGCRSHWCPMSNTMHDLPASARSAQVPQNPLYAQGLMFAFTGCAITCYRAIALLTVELKHVPLDMDEVGLSLSFSFPRRRQPLCCGASGVLALADRSSVC